MVVDIRRLPIAVLVYACGCGSTSLPFLEDAARPTDGAVDAPPARQGTSPAHHLYLRVDGGAFLSGSDDAVHSSTSILAAGTANLHAFAEGAGDRASRITTIETEVAAILAPYDITVDVAPPADPGEVYQEIVVTDSSPTLLGVAASTGAIQPLTCTPRGNEVGFVFATAGTPTPSEHLIVERIVGMLGVFSQVPLTLERDDCMCYLHAQCGAPTFACTIGGAGVLLDLDNTPCLGAHPPGNFDENAAWLAAFGPHVAP